MKNTLSNLFLCVIGALMIISCEKSESGTETDNNGSGKGGSMARFTIYKDYLYTVDQQKLNIFKIADPEKPVYISNIQAGYNIETIFARNNTLFLGSELGMFIYDITEPEKPVSLSFFQHIYSCDPVVANDTLAYLTMRTETFCGRNTNELQVIDIKDRKNPYFVSRMVMTKPYGLGIEGDKLFVCDDGLKLLSLTDPLHPVVLKTFNMPAIDVIPDKDLLMVLATDGLYQYSYINDNLTLLSHLQ